MLRPLRDPNTFAGNKLFRQVQPTDSSMIDNMYCFLTYLTPYFCRAATTFPLLIYPFIYLIMNHLIYKMSDNIDKWPSHCDIYRSLALSEQPKGIQFTSSLQLSIIFINCLVYKRPENSRKLPLQDNKFTMI